MKGEGGWGGGWRSLGFNCGRGLAGDSVAAGEGFLCLFAHFKRGYDVVLVMHNKLTLNVRDEMQ